MTSAYPGIYDFELLPYALGDVLTWNVQSAVAAHKAGRKRVDIYICLDPRYPASIYQRGLINENNYRLFFNELFGAFNTHPMLGDITIYHDRQRLLASLDELVAEDPKTSAVIDLYKKILAGKDDIQTLPPYFISQIYSHEVLNDFAAKNGFLPQLQDSPGCLPDIEALLAKPLAGRRVVVIHPRLRRLDLGYGGDHTFSRDSDVLEWMEFIQTTQKTRPEVQFVVMGRLQEKPLSLLEQPNVMSLRSLGLGLGHELTLLRKAELFIGASSGFAAMANFCSTPYFITKMNPESCKAYAIPEGQKALPFAHPNQELVYGDEDAKMLTKLLERGLALKPAPKGKAPVRYNSLDPKDHAAERKLYLTENASTARYFADDLAIDAEAAYLLWPKMHAGFVKLDARGKPKIEALKKRIEEHFPRLYEQSDLIQNLHLQQHYGAVAPSASVRLKKYWREQMSKLDATSLPPWMRNRLVLVPARWLKSALVRRPVQ